MNKKRERKSFFIETERHVKKKKSREGKRMKLGKMSNKKKFREKVFILLLLFGCHVI